MSEFKGKLTFVRRAVYSDDHRNRDIFSVYCSFSSYINPNAGNCSIFKNILRQMEGSVFSRNVEMLAESDGCAWLFLRHRSCVSRLFRAV